MTWKGVGVGTLFSLNHVGVQVVAMFTIFVLCLTLGVERHLRHKNASAKTHVLVGLGSCLFTLVSVYGFAPITGSDVVVDPSRVAAQIISGIGFLGARVISVNNDTIRGLTTAMIVWLSAAIDMACGAGMILLVVTAIAPDYIVVLFLGPPISCLQHRRGEVTMRIGHEIGSAVMPGTLQAATVLGSTATLKEIEVTRGEHGCTMNAVMRFHRRHPAVNLIEIPSGLDDVDGIECLERGRLD